jgi:hypothetical protein
VPPEMTDPGPVAPYGPVTEMGKRRLNVIRDSARGGYRTRLVDLSDNFEIVLIEPPQTGIRQFDPPYNHRQQAASKRQPGLISTSCRRSYSRGPCKNTQPP